MRNRLIAFFVTAMALGNIGTALADGITVDQARENAMSFLNKRNTQSSGAKSTMQASSALTLAYQSNDNSVYVFNINGGGYVITSGDDCAFSILGYSNGGSFNYATASDAQKYMLGEYSREIEWAKTNGVTNVATEAPAGRHDVDTLITTLWSQGAPYNDLCPIVSGYKGQTGCVATAIAQVMNYHKWPEKGNGTVTDTQTDDIEVPTIDLSQSTYDWNNMIKQYIAETDYFGYVLSTNYDEVQAKAVATLMRDVGYAVDMSYGPGLSTAYDDKIAYALIHNFGYDAGIHLEFADDYTAEQWDSLAYSEMAAGRPVVYGATSDAGGHAFVIDGYDSKNDMFHVNWGWSGTSNNYYKLTALNPPTSGVGMTSSSKSLFFNREQTMLAGMQKPTGKTYELIPMMSCHSILAKYKKEGKNYLKGMYTSISNDTLKKANTVAVFTNKNTGEETYLPFTYDEILLPGDETANCYQEVCVDDMKVADGSYVVKMMFRVGYDQNAAIEKSQLHNIKVTDTLTDNLLLSVENGVNTWSFPESVESEFRIKVFPTAISENTKDYQINAHFMNIGTDRPMKMAAHIGYYDEEQKFVIMSSSDTMSVNLEYSEQVDGSFSFKDVKFNELEALGQKYYIAVIDTLGNIYCTENVLVRRINPFIVVKPIVCNQVADGKIAAKYFTMGGSYDISFDGQIDLKGVSNVGYLYVVFENEEIPIDPTSEYFSPGEYKGASVYMGSIGEGDTSVDFSGIWPIMDCINDGIKDGDRLKMHVMGAYNKKIYVLQDPISLVVGDATAVREVNGQLSPASSGAMYNLTGQRVNANAKGIIIVNGKKLIQTK